MTKYAISRFPAILIGGPPHAGKSVLAQALKKGLRQAGVPFHHFSATPDGEGDWFQEAPPETGRALRQKGAFTQQFVAQVCHDIAQRPMPFLIDVGGKPKAWQQQIFDHCTHAILLVKDEESARQWQTMMQQWDVIIIALIDSQLEGQSTLEAETPIIKGRLTHLERHNPVAGPLFELLLARLKALLRYEATQLFERHQAEAPVKPVIDFRALYEQLYPDRQSYSWQPQDIPLLLNQLPSGCPLALYGSAPVWLYAAVAHSVRPQPLYLFDARLGWLAPASLNHLGGERAATDCVLQTDTLETEQVWYVQVATTTYYLRHQPYYVNLPQISPQQGVIFSGKLPMWLQTSLALHYQQAAWVAFYEPRQNGAVVVATMIPDEVAVGELLPLSDKEDAWLKR